MQRMVQEGDAASLLYTSVTKFQSSPATGRRKFLECKTFSVSFVFVLLLTKLCNIPVETI